MEVDWSEIEQIFEDHCFLSSLSVTVKQDMPKNEVIWLMVVTRKCRMSPKFAIKQIQNTMAIVFVLLVKLSREIRVVAIARGSS